jgi:hypothetical protein
MSKDADMKHLPVTPEQEADRALIRAACQATGMDTSNLARSLGIAASTLNKPMAGPVSHRLSRKVIDLLTNFGRMIRPIKLKTNFFHCRGYNEIEYIIGMLANIAGLGPNRTDHKASSCHEAESRHYLGKCSRGNFTRSH